MNSTEFLVLAILSFRGSWRRRGEEEVEGDKKQK